MWQVSLHSHYIACSIDCSSLHEVQESQGGNRFSEVCRGCEPKREAMQKMMNPDPL